MRNQRASIAYVPEGNKDYSTLEMPLHYGSSLSDSSLIAETTSEPVDAADVVERVAALFDAKDCDIEAISSAATDCQSELSRTDVTARFRLSAGTAARLRLT